MSLSGSPAAQVDPRMQQFIHQETEKQKVQNVLHELNEKCWDTCMDNVRPSTRLDSKTENCIRNCVERFLDTNILVTNRLEKKAEEMLQKHDALGGGGGAYD